MLNYILTEFKQVMAEGKAFWIELVFPRVGKVLKNLKTRVRYLFQKESKYDSDILLNNRYRVYRVIGGN